MEEEISTEDWTCGYCNKKQKVGTTKYKDYDEIICSECMYRAMDSWDDVVHIPSMP